MNTRKIGIILIIVGIVLTVITGFKFFTKEKVVDLGPLEIAKETPHKVNWSPYVGVGIIVLGGIMVLAGPRKV